MASVSRSRLRHVARGEAVSKRQRVLFFAKRRGQDRLSRSRAVPEAELVVNKKTNPPAQPAVHKSYFSALVVQVVVLRNYSAYPSVTWVGWEE